jgi:hypothetical protein
MQSHTNHDPPDRFPTDPSGLPEARRPQVLELAHGDALDLTVGPMPKLGEATVRMLGYNGSVPGPTLKVHQGSEIIVQVTTQGDLDTTLHPPCRTCRRTGRPRSAGGPAGGHPGSTGGGLAAARSRPTPHRRLGCRTTCHPDRRRPCSRKSQWCGQPRKTTRELGQRYCRRSIRSRRSGGAPNSVRSRET